MGYATFDKNQKILWDRIVRCQKGVITKKKGYFIIGPGHYRPINIGMDLANDIDFSP